MYACSSLGMSINLPMDTKHFVVITKIMTIWKFLNFYSIFIIDFTTNFQLKLNYQICRLYRDVS